MAKALMASNGGSSTPPRGGGRPLVSTAVLVALNSIVLLTLQQFFFLGGNATGGGNGGGGGASSSAPVDASPAPGEDGGRIAASPFGLVIPRGSATALPSVRISEDEERAIDRNFYGGKGDKAHLGGFTSFDPMGVSPTLWTHMVNHLGIKSMLDLGCGRGISTSWFILHGLNYVVCAEGSHDAVTQSLLPQIDEKYPDLAKSGKTYELVEHDFSRGPWWPERTVDLAWCVEFTEHVGRNYIHNYHTAFRKAALIFVTHSNWGGWHHVEVHDNDWWQVKMEASGFVYSEVLTKEMKGRATKDSHRTDLVKDMAVKNKTTYNVAQHLWTSLQVFINPLVASLPEHAHLFAEHGCYGRGGKGQECGKQGGDPGVAKLTPLPESFKPLNMTKEMDDRWMDLIKDLKL